MLRKLLAAAGIVVLAILVLVGATWASDKTVAELKPKWAPPPSTFLAVNGMQVHLRDEGPREDAEPIVLLHGTSSSLHTWDGWTTELRKTRRVVRMDLPGFGLTGPDPKQNYSIAAYVRFVQAVLDSLHVKRAVVMGNSLGGQIAWNLAIEDSARVAKLVLVDAAGFPLNSTSVPIGFRLARSPVFGPLMRFILPRSVVESSVKNVFGDPSRVTPELVDRYYDLTLREGNRAAVVARFKQSNARSAVERLGELRMPTLIMWGQKDHLIDPATAELFKQSIRGSTIVMYTGLGHIPHEEDPVSTLRNLVTFLDAPVAPTAASAPATAKKR